MRMELGREILVWVSALGYCFFLILTYMCTCMFTYVCSKGTKSDIGYLPQPLPNLFIEVGSCS